MSLPLPLFALALAACLGCSTRNPPGESGRPEQASTPAKQSAPAGQLGAESKAAAPKPLSAYLGATATIEVYDSSNPRATRLVETLTGGAAKAYLATLDLEQVADGPLVRCPATTVYAFKDAAGERLGAISFCGDHARFDGPDGTFGGVEAKASPASR